MMTQSELRRRRRQMNRRIRTILAQRRLAATTGPDPDATDQDTRTGGATDAPIEPVSEGPPGQPQ